VVVKTTPFKVVIIYKK